MAKSKKVVSRKSEKVVVEVVSDTVVDPSAQDAKDMEAATGIVSIPAPAGGISNATGQLTDQVPDIVVLEAVKKLKLSTDSIRYSISDVADSFVSIGDELAKLRDDKGVLEACGYSDVYDYSWKVFGFKRTSTKNFIAVAEKFAKNGSLLQKYDGYNFTQLVELLPVSEDIASYKPEMTVAEIRDKKVLDAVKSDEEKLRSWVECSLNKSLSSFYQGAIVSALKSEEGNDEDSDFVEVPFQFSIHTPDFGFRGNGRFNNGFFDLSELHQAGKRLFVYVSEKTAKDFASSLKKKIDDEIGRFSDSSSGKTKKEAPQPPKPSPYDAWLSLSYDKKLALIRPSAFNRFDDGGDHPFFVDSWLMADVGLDIVSDTFEDSGCVIVGRYLPKDGNPSEVVCASLFYLFLTDNIKTGIAHLRMDEEDSFNSGKNIIDYLDGIAKDLRSRKSGKKDSD